MARRSGITNTFSLNYLREIGWKNVDVCQRQTGPVSRDLFGFLDLMAMDDDGMLGVQACTSNDYRLHLRKLGDMTDAVHRFASHNKLEIHVWRKLKNKSVPGKGLKWTPRVVDVVAVKEVPEETMVDVVYVTPQKIVAWDEPVIEECEK